MTSNDLWYALPMLRGPLVRLEPLALEHAPGYLAAAGTGPDAADVFRWLNPHVGTAPEPSNLAEATQHILRALASRAAGERFAYAQFDVRTDTFIGTSSYYEVSPASKSLGIGHTWLGKPWWRTGHNTESKLLMLTHAFQTLGAARVVWHTDIYNTRSQDAIARLGATKEGVLRKHRIRFDGSWRDTVQYSMTDDDWPAAQTRLAARLTR